jgi:hypothetical protein
MSIICPHCQERPGSHVKPYGRWRWLTAHIVAEHHNVPFTAHN